ncbi:hypothetical protein C8F00_2796 [Xanthomonas vasicola]
MEILLGSARRLACRLLLALPRAHRHIVVGAVHEQFSSMPLRMADMRHCLRHRGKLRALEVTRQTENALRITSKLAKYSLHVNRVDILRPRFCGDGASIESLQGSLVISQIWPEQSESNFCSYSCRLICIALSRTCQMQCDPYCANRSDCTGPVGSKVVEQHAGQKRWVDKKNGDDRSTGCSYKGCRPTAFKRGPNAGGYFGERDSVPHMGSTGRIYATKNSGGIAHDVR